MPQTRRKFVKTALTSAGVVLSMSKVFASVQEEIDFKTRKISLSENDVVLFQGDSITDVGRDRSINQPNNKNGLGFGYPFIVATDLLLNHPDKNLKIYNRGISGNKVPQLIERWEEDGIDLKPDILSILIGVNDYWHTLNGDYDGTPEKYRSSYDKLLKQTKDKLPDVQLIIGEPYALKQGSAVDENWFPEFDKYREIAREMADKYDAVFIPYQEIYEKEIQSVKDPLYWSDDGVHPTTAGGGLMAQAILQVFK